MSKRTESLQKVRELVGLKHVPDTRAGYFSRSEAVWLESFLKVRDRETLPDDAKEGTKNE